VGGARPSTAIDQSFLPGLALGLETLAAFGLDD
jgi:hypothetical protein